MNEIETLIGLMAGTLTTLAFLPQVVQIWRSKCANDVSALTFTIFSLGVFLWIVYGVTIHALPIIITNIVTLILSLLILMLKWKYSKKDE